MPDFLPDRLEAGTHNVPGWLVCWKGCVPPAAGNPFAVLPRGGAVRQAAEGLAQLPRVQVDSAGEKGCQSGVLSFRVAGRDPGWVAEELGQRGIAVRAGLHCAPLAHATGGTEATGTVRVSFSAFNTGQEVERFLKTMRRLG
ncbi:MAG: aminotransferase class V-fold PLP-dependent enzyme [Evtepia gabavorous]